MWTKIWEPNDVSPQHWAKRGSPTSICNSTASVYLYVRLPFRSFFASRNKLNASMTSQVGYHKCDCGRAWELVSWKENLLFLVCCTMSFRVWFCLEMSEFMFHDGSQSGNLTMKSMLWSCHKFDLKTEKKKKRKEKSVSYKAKLHKRWHNESKGVFYWFTW